MKNIFILETNDRSLNFFWPGKLDTLNQTAFTNTSDVTPKNIEKPIQYFLNNNAQLLIYTCFCIVLTFLIVKRSIVKKK